jgi:hypothetical protein
LRMSGNRGMRGSRSSRTYFLGLYIVSAYIGKYK